MSSNRQLAAILIVTFQKMGSGMLFR